MIYIQELISQYSYQNCISSCTVQKLLPIITYYLSLEKSAQNLLNLEK